MEVLERWAKDPILLNMLQRQQIVLGHTLPLGTYLCKPVQRILKYHLLLKASRLTRYALFMIILVGVVDKVLNASCVSHFKTLKFLQF